MIVTFPSVKKKKRRKEKRKEKERERKEKEGRKKRYAICAISRVVARSRGF